MGVGISAGTARRRQMISMISLVIGSGAAALAVASAALGATTPTGAHPQASPSAAYLDAGERTAAVQSRVQVDRRTDAWDREASAQHPTTYVDAPERSAQPTNLNSTYVDANERGTGTAQPVAASSSGNDIEWPQIGFGFGIGIALALGLVLGFRATRQRPLAH